MPAIADPPPLPVAKTDTVADLLDRLGGIAPGRVRLWPPLGTATEADMIANNDAGNSPLCELIDGTLVEKAMGNRESAVAAMLVALLNTFVAPRRLGWVLGADSLFRLANRQIRMPDVAFISIARWPGGMPDGPVSDFAPELAVEVYSAGNTAAEMRIKRRDYFGRGVKLVWIVFPLTRTVAVYTSPDGSVERSAADTLDGGEAVPGFAVRVADLFAPLDLRAEG